ncbi:hypothetical protein PQ610_03395 [Tardisphaera miroshnichenkoae]
MDKALVKINVDGEDHVVSLVKARIPKVDDFMSTLKQKKIPVALVDSSYAPQSILVAAAYTLIDIKRGTGIAKDPVMQFALNLTGTHQLSKALEKVYPRSDVGYLVGMDADLGELNGLYEPLELEGISFDAHVVEMFSARANGVNWKYRKSS